MKHIISVLAIASLAAVVPAHATIFSASFTGTVYQTTGATGRAVGDTVSGQFDLNDSTGRFLDFIIDGNSVSPGYESSVSISQGGFDAIYTAQVSPVSSGMSSNSTFSLDLSSLTNWPSSDTAYTLLVDTAQLTTNLDTVNNPLSAFPSALSYYTANSDGTNVVSLRADLTSITAAAAVPEPATLTLFASSLLGLGFFAHRRNT